MKTRLKLFKKGNQCDFIIVMLVAILVIFGVVMIFSASYYKSINESGSPYGYLKKQFIFAIIGATAMWVLSYVDYHNFKGWIAEGFAVVSIILLLLVITSVGATVNGSSRWIHLGPITIMPGEIVKAAVIILLAKFISDDPERIVRIKDGLVPILIVTVLCVLLIMKQPNLSTAMTLAGIVLGMTFLAGLDLKYIIAIAGLGVLLVCGIAVSGTYWATRLFSFWDPFKAAKDDGFQAVQSLLALGTGGLTGRGLGESIQKTLYLPEPQNDFILAIIGEEMGLAGVLVMLTVFIILIWRCAKVTINAPDLFGMLFAGGVTMMIGIQVILNIAVVTSSMPPTGVALPFISYGGNTLWIFMGCIGILLNISRQSTLYESKEDRGSLRTSFKRRRSVRKNKAGRSEKREKFI